MDGPTDTESDGGGTLTHVVAHRPVLVIVKVDLALPVGPGEVGVGQDPSRTVKG